jgi:broad specificity phosphatase PhoE
LGAWNGLSDGRASVPISEDSVADLRKLVLRTLNDNQILILSEVARRKDTMTSLLRALSEEFSIPLSTLKLNGRILRELRLISYGSREGITEARLGNLGFFILRLLSEEHAPAQFSD